MLRISSESELNHKFKMNPMRRYESYTNPKSMTCHRRSNTRINVWELRRSSFACVWSVISHYYEIYCLLRTKFSSFIFIIVIINSASIQFCDLLLFHSFILYEYYCKMMQTKEKYKNVPILFYRYCRVDRGGMGHRGKMGR